MRYLGSNHVSCGSVDEGRDVLTSVLSGHLLRVSHDLFPDLAKVEELLPRQVQELSPFIGIVGI